MGWETLCTAVSCRERSLSYDRLLAVERRDRLYLEARRPHPRGNELRFLDVGEVERDPDARRLAAHLEDGDGQGGPAVVADVEGRRVHVVHAPRRIGSGANCIKIGLPGESILRYYFQENRTSQSPFLLLRISFPGRPIFIQFIPDRANDLLGVVEGQHVLGRERRVSQLTGGEVAVELRGQTVGPVDRHAGALAGVLESDLERLGLVLKRMTIYALINLDRDFY